MGVSVCFTGSFKVIYLRVFQQRQNTRDKQCKISLFRNQFNVSVNIYNYLKCKWFRINWMESNERVWYHRHLRKNIQNTIHTTFTFSRKYMIVLYGFSHEKQKFTCIFSSIGNLLFVKPTLKLKYTHSNSDNAAYKCA